MREWLVAAAVIGIANTAHAGGSYVPEIGARATGMGASVVADGDDPSAVFHDPANLARADGFQVEGAADLVFPRITFFRRPLVDPNTGANLHFDAAENTNRVIAVPFVGASYRLDRDTGAGLALYAPFGATLDFPADGAQRQILTHIAQRTIFLSPAIARALPGGFAVGASANFIYSDLVLDQRNAIPYVTGDPEQYPDPQGELQGTTHLSGRDPFTMTATLGASWRARDGRVRVGASVMTPTHLHYKGDARIANTGISGLFDDAGNQLQPAGVRTDQIAISVPLPLVARVGVAAQLGDRVHLELDVNYTRWSTFKELVVDFQHEYALLQTPGANLYDVHIANDWHDAWTVRLGVEATPWSRALALRGGIVYDQSPIDDRHFSLLTPDSDKLGVTAGASWRTGHFDLQLAFAELFVRDRDVAPTASGPGSDGTILNKPAPSFFHGITRTGISILTFAVAWRQ